MKHKIKYIVLGSLLLGTVLFCLTPLHVYAATVIQKGVTLISGQYDLDSYNSYMASNEGIFGFFTGDTMPNLISDLANVFFGLNKIIWSVVDRGLEILFKADAISAMSSQVSSIATTVYSNLFSALGGMLFAVGIIWSFVSYFMLSNRRAFRNLLMVILVIIGTKVWFNNTNTYLKAFNGWSSELQTKVMTATNGEAGNGDSGDSTKNAVTAVRNDFFKTAIQSPYYLMNYGTTDVTKIKHPNQFLSKDYDKNQENISKDVKKSADSNKYLSVSKVTYKLSIAFISNFSTLLIGIPYFAIGFANLAIQVVALVMVPIMAILAIISLLPRYGDSFFNGFKKLVGLFFAKALLGLLVLFLNIILTTVDTLIVPNTSGTFFVNLIVKGVLIFLAWHFRDQLSKTVTGDFANRVPQALGAAGSKVVQVTKEKVSDVKEGLREKGVRLAAIGMDVPPELVDDMAAMKRTSQKPTTEEDVPLTGTDEDEPVKTNDPDSEEVPVSGAENSTETDGEAPNSGSEIPAENDVPPVEAEVPVDTELEPETMDDSALDTLPDDDFRTPQVDVETPVNTDLEDGTIDDTNLDDLTAQAYQDGVLDLEEPVDTRLVDGEVNDDQLGELSDYAGSEETVSDQVEVDQQLDVKQDVQSLADNAYNIPETDYLSDEDYSNVVDFEAELARLRA